MLIDSGEGEWQFPNSIVVHTIPPACGPALSTLIVYEKGTPGRPIRRTKQFKVLPLTIA